MIQRTSPVLTFLKHFSANASANQAQHVSFTAARDRLADQAARVAPPIALLLSVNNIIPKKNMILAPSGAGFGNHAGWDNWSAI